MSIVNRFSKYQAKFHWHAGNKGIRHAYIKATSPQLKGKMERAHRSDQQELYHLANYNSDIDLEDELTGWGNLYNFARPHGDFNGKTPYEALKEKAMAAQPQNFPIAGEQQILRLTSRGQL